MSRRRIALTFLALTLSGMLASACKENKGPFEKAGEDIDETVNDAKRKVEDATD